MATKAEAIHRAALDLVFGYAVKSSEGFRQWVYPNLPNDYSWSIALDDEINAGVTAGKSATQIAEAIYKTHS